MRKIPMFFILFSIIIMMLCFNVYADTVNTDTEVTEPESTVDIGLFYGSTAKESVTITCMGNPVTVNTAEIVEDTEYNSDGIIAVDGTEYRGSIILKKDDNGLFTVVNRVNMEDYIASVIAVEMSPSFNIEALKAQAVCARTYAIKNMGKHKSRGFDLCASVDCQAYKGVSVEHETTNMAAKQTAGQVMTYKGEIINAVYSATSGGWTEDVENVWGSDIPYLAAVEDAYESKEVYGSSWEKEISVEKATEIMDSKGYELGTVTNIEVAEQTDRGAVTKLTVTGTNGEKSFTREGCRLAFGNVVLSQAYTVEPVYETSVKKEKIYTYDGKEISGNATLLTVEGTTTVDLNNVCLKGSTERMYPEKTEGKITGFVFNGRGFGHLVGLSQNGANGMAGAGFTYDEILKHYYKGIEIS